MSERRRRATVLGTVVGAVSAGVAAGLAVERLAVGRERLRPDPEASEPFGRLAGRERVVTTEDGVPLHVEEVGDGPLTVVFCHGFALSLASWHYQRRDLADVGRLVFYDHRAHGRSGPSEDDRCTIDQLGRDLGRVLDEVAPHGPIALVGHSMGGMTIMSLADDRPELFGSRVVAVALVGTSAGHLVEALLPLPLRAANVVTNRLYPLLQPRLRRRAALLERGRRVGSDLNFVLARRWGFGDNPSPAQVEFVERMLAATPFDVITSFTPTFLTHDRLEALDVLARVPVLLLVGDRDRVTPAAHSREIAARVPGAELVVFDGAGHMVLVERAPLVNLHLRAFLRRAARGSRSRRGA